MPPPTTATRKHFGLENSVMAMLVVGIVVRFFLLDLEVEAVAVLVVAVERLRLTWEFES